MHQPMAAPAQAQQRLPDAGARLRALLRERWAQPFEWGVNDCCLFAADCVLAQTGRDPAAGWRGRYRNAAEAGRLVHRLGGMERMAGAVLGMSLPTPLHARLGDVGLNRASNTLLVCLGQHWAGPGAQGLRLLPLAGADLAWRVGRHG